MTLIDNPPSSLATPTPTANGSNGVVTVLIAPELSSDESSSSIAFKQRGKNTRTPTGLSDQDDVRKDRSLSVFDVCKDTFDYALSRWRMEKVLLRLNWRILACGIVFQYFHSVATNVVYYLHVPRTPLYDLGFELFPALSRQMQIVSEIMFFILLFSTIFFIASPLIFRRQSHLFTTTMATRFLGVCFFAQVLRCMTFLVTVLPGPNYHCRPGAPDYSPPQNLYDIFMRQDAFYGCGDLVFSSHTIFVCLCALTITKYADNTLVKKAVWVLVFFFGCLVVSARKHYSIDILVAWYTVPLLWVAFDKYYPDRIPNEFLEPDAEPKKAPKVVV